VPRRRTPSQPSPCRIRRSNNDSWFDLRRQLCRIAESTCRACRARSNSLSPEGRNRIRDPIRASQLARCFSLRARAPRQFVSTPLGRPVGAMILTACSPNGNHSVDNPSESQDEWRKLPVWMAPPCFCVGHPLWGTGEPGFPAVPKRKLPADTRFRRKIHSCDPEYALNYAGPTAGL
jgi:hypothetical protein